MEIKTIFSLLVILLSCHIKPCGSECPVLYQGTKGHSACVSRSSDFISGSVSESDQKIILQEHNKFRAMTPACYMIKLYWNKEAAYVAQKWAENCEFEHDKKRSIPGYFSCGQNLGLGYTSWKSVITAWYDEIKDFTLDGKNVVSKVGHYTQVVWATSALIGCGFAKCQKGMRLYVCNYCPSGNNGGVNHPYDKCSNKTALQDCKGKVCQNTGAMEKTACKCKCPRYGHIYGPECNINCSVKDTGFCNNQFKENSCRFSNVPAQCPWMCKTCPYLEQYRNQVILTSWRTGVFASQHEKCSILFHGLFKQHSACTRPSRDYISGGISASDKKLIVSEHNRYRLEVNPPACFMLKMYWDNLIAATAQGWASKCIFKHDSLLNRLIPGQFVLGQNLGMNFPSWKDAIAVWVSEKKDFKYGENPNMKLTSNYSQIVFSQNVRIGCGFAKCKHFKYYVCNYGPRGPKNAPYKNCSKSAGLKDCKKKKCYNEARIKPGTCTCECSDSENIYGSYCETNCSVKDTLPCNTGWKKNSCLYAFVITQCPWMCNTCPFIEQYRLSMFLVLWQNVKTTVIISKREVLTKKCPVIFHGILTRHSACRHPSKNFLSGGISEDDKKFIVKEHNKIRSQVDPPACYMQKMYWDDLLAQAAQGWASNCQFSHDRPLHRNIPGRYVLGQNLAKNYDNWKATILAWLGENKIFVHGKAFGLPYNFMDIKNYTQMVYSQNSRIGCGFAHCKELRLYVCNYGPDGQLFPKSKPYTKCEKNAPLKDCKNKVCENGGQMEEKTCKCRCLRRPHLYGSTCKVNCSFSDKPPCRVMWKKSCCWANVVPSNCPWMCRTCPYIDQYRQILSGSAPGAWDYSMTMLILTALPLWLQ